MSRDYRKIKAWQLADDITVEVYNITRSFPKEEIYGLTSQLRRAISSVPANIVEGATRSHKKEYVHFLNIARVSLAEADDFLHLAKRLNYFDEKRYNEISKKINELGATLYGLMQAVKKEV
ncbi:MAG: four helix bundle protein [Thermodesulfobacteriota bacterium]|nr:four helix bundle protein [Thermodesulfobacteriota bacterium]